MTLGQTIKNAKRKLGTVPAGWFLLVASGSLAIWAGWEPIHAFLRHPHQPSHVALWIAAGCLAFIGTGLLMARRVARMSEVTDKSRRAASGKQDDSAGTAGYPKALVQVAGQIKAAIQMAIGVYALGWLVWSFFFSHRIHNCAAATTTLSGDHSIHEQFCYLIPPSAVMFSVVADALAAATVVQLTYTLFTPGPDEALDPVMLALATAMLLELGQVTQFKWQDGVAIILYAAGLGLLFVVRIFLAPDEDDPPELWWWKRRRFRPVRPR
jgi:hypothetical protein